MQRLRDEQQSLSDKLQQARLRQVESNTANHIQEDAEMALGRVEGLVSELEEDTKVPVDAETMRSPSDADKSPESDRGLPKQSIAPKGETSDPWDDVLS